MSIQSINPLSGEILQNYQETSAAEVSEQIKKSDQAFQSWRELSYLERSNCMKNAAQKLRSDAKGLAKLMALEMGKPLKEGESEITKCALACDYFADNAKSFLKKTLIKTEARKSYVTYEPLGIVLAIMPWNFPFWQVFRFAAPGLMAGNVGLLKHASNVPGCALAIEDIFTKAGFPQHVFKTLLVSSENISSVIDDPLVKAVTLTGSTAAGKDVANKAGKVLKKTVLELGGSDAYVILKDADLELAATTCVKSRLLNAGQSCISAKRFIIAQEIYNDFEKLFVEKMKSTVMGDPLEPTTTTGPLAREDLRNKLHEQVQQSIRQGAQCLLGGEIPSGKGFFYPPTVLKNVKRGMPAYDDELFGPVAALIKVKNEKEAIHVANDSIYGLGAAVFTQNIKKGEKIAATKLNAGSCFVNSLVQSDPRLPFGGIKQSGYGRELSYLGIKEFVNIKTVSIG